ncbi:acyltransferase family protein [Mucilaginibacter sp. AW1-7]|uniref:acyltransferase family protein n=1 Tax=Mucilaginibacter sp. AW1-7 TaxID=3349874 RepID=UPI003F73E8C6
MPRHNHAIDMLRFFAALGVALFHLNQAITTQDNWYRHTVRHGSLGVPVFFVVSGYCIILSAQNGGNTWDFLRRRFFRIYPAYWVSLAVVLAAAFFQKLYIGSNAVHFLPRNPAGVVTAITLTTAPLSSTPTINWVYWSLTCELLFYLVVSLTLPFDKKRMIYFLTGISLLSALIPEQHTGLLFFLDHWPAFGMGISIYYLFGSANLLSWCRATGLTLINLFGLWSKFGTHPEYIAVALVAFGLIMLSNKIKVPANRFASWGQYSYSVYLIHVPVGVFILGLFEAEAIKQHPFYNLVYDLSVFTLIAILARVMFTRVEVPAIAFGKKSLKK